jgi:cyclin G2
LHFFLPEEIAKFYLFAIQVNENSLWYCYEVVVASLKQYEEQTSLPYKQQLVWRVSQRTFRTLRPTSQFDRELETIQEEGQC